jgi:signal transduction histidine kinase
VIAKAMELGALRHSQGFDEYELLKEYEIFGGILYSFLASAVENIDQECSRSELILCAHRLYQAITLIQQATTTQFLALMKERLSEREDRLRAFNRTLTHELRNRIGATMGAGQLLQIPEIADTERERLVGVVVRNMESMRVALDNLLELTRLSSDSRQQRHVLLPRAAAEVVRQLRELARSRQTTVRVQSDLPEVEVNAAAIELCLMNYLSNALKYADAQKAERWVEIAGRIQPATSDAPAHAVIEVVDNGVGVPADQRGKLFERFFRAGVDSATGVEGTGLGLSIVRETVEALGGRAWAEFAEGEERVRLLPSRAALHRSASHVERARDELVATAPCQRVGHGAQRLGRIDVDRTSARDRDDVERVAQSVEHGARTDVALEG